MVRFQLHINGKPWTVRSGRRDMANRGECDYHTRTITVRNGLPPSEVREVLIHEIVHAECDALDEETVLRIGETAARALDRWELQCESA